MTKCIFCDVEGEFYKGAAIGPKGRGICGNCLEWLTYYMRRQILIEKENEGYLGDDRWAKDRQKQSL